MALGSSRSTEGLSGPHEVGTWKLTLAFEVANWSERGGGEVRGSPAICLSETLVSRAPRRLARGPDVVALLASCPRSKGGRELITLKGEVLVLD